MESLSRLHETLLPYYSTIALVLTWALFGVAWWRRRSQWRNKEFLGQVNFSLNLFGETLSMRTLKEVETTAVWPNAHGIGLIHQAARRTTPEDPFIRLKSDEDRAYLYRAIKNSLSQLCAESFIGRSLGIPVRTGTFLFALTCERYAEMRTIKIRVLIIEENTLREWCEPGGKGDSLPIEPFYRTRLRTLQAMYEMDRQVRAGGPPQLGRVELGFLAS